MVDKIDHLEKVRSKAIQVIGGFEAHIPIDLNTGNDEQADTDDNGIVAVSFRGPPYIEQTILFLPGASGKQ